ncbi:MAG: EamA family transporter [Candidatus Daviesbacteria bacterium]|nr:EamA family transporter [Candidatus Daviesbacteria bacterium]
MSPFIPIAILGNVLNAGATVVDKILLNKQLPNILSYIFYINILGLLAIFLIPFGFTFNISALTVAFTSGLVFVVALFAFFQALKKGEASVVAPIVGVLTPGFTFLIGTFFGQSLTNSQMLAFIVLLLGSVILTLSSWMSKIKLNTQIGFMILAGALFAVHYLLAKESYTQSNFITGLVGGRVGSGILVASFLLFAKGRSEIFASKIRQNNFANKTSVLLIFGQTMGGLFGLLNNYAISLASPALVNSLFGVQYVVIVIVALVLYKNHPDLLGEKLSVWIILQKIVGVVVMSFGLYLLTQ